MEFIVKRGAGFIYYLSRDGVPGMRMQDAVGANLAQPVDRIRAHASLPVAVGLGISNPEQAKLVAESADAVVIGNAVVYTPKDVSVSVGPGQMELKLAFN